MQTNEKLISVLNDLVKINNDRVSGYEKASAETETIDVDLRAIFMGYANDSQKYANELALEVKRLGGESAEGTTGLGKIYRAWMDVKSTFTGQDRQAILSSCEYGEDQAQKAYADALASDAEMNADIRQLITTQKAALKKSHDIIKKYRDAHDLVK